MEPIVDWLNPKNFMGDGEFGGGGATSRW